MQVSAGTFAYVDACEKNPPKKPCRRVWNLHCFANLLLLTVSVMHFPRPNCTNGLKMKIIIKKKLLVDKAALCRIT